MGYSSTRTGKLPAPDDCAAEVDGRLTDCQPVAAVALVASPVRAAMLVRAMPEGGPTVVDGIMDHRASWRLAAAGYSEHDGRGGRCHQFSRAWGPVHRAHHRQRGDPGGALRHRWFQRGWAAPISAG